MAEEPDRASERGGFNPEFDHHMETRAPLQLLRMRSEYEEYYGGKVEVMTVCEPASEVLRKVQGALDSHTELRHSTQSVQASLTAGKIDLAELQGAFTASAEAMAKIEDFLHACVASFPTSMRPTSQSHVKAEQVLSTAELLEAIYLYLSPKELLQAVRVNHATFQIFKDSPKLLAILQLRARKDGHLSNIFEDSGFAGLIVTVDNPLIRQRYSLYGPDLAFNQIAVEVNFHSHTTARIGSLCRSILILQPPVRSVKVTVSCCSLRRHRSSNNGFWGGGSSTPFSHGHIFGNDDDDGGDADWSRAMAISQGEESEESGEEDLQGTFNENVTETLEIRAQAGITVGHFYDAVQKLRLAHRHCPHAALHDHDADGTVRPSISFLTTINLEKNDPYLIEKDKVEVRNRLSDVEPHKKQCIMQIYIDSKKRAFENEWPILSLDEFKRWYDVDHIVGSNLKGWASSQQGDW